MLTDTASRMGISVRKLGFDGVSLRHALAQTHTDWGSESSTVSERSSWKQNTKNQNKNIEEKEMKII